MNLLLKISKYCFGFKGSATESLLLEKVTREAGAEYPETSWKGGSYDLSQMPLFLDCNIVGPEVVLSERKKAVTDAIVKTAKDLLFYSYPLNGGSVYIISKQRIPADRIKDAERFGFDDNLCRYLTISIKANCAI